MSPEEGLAAINNFVKYPQDKDVFLANTPNVFSLATVLLGEKHCFVAYFARPVDILNDQEVDLAISGEMSRSEAFKFSQEVVQQWCVTNDNNRIPLGNSSEDQDTYQQFEKVGKRIPLDLLINLYRFLALRRQKEKNAAFFDKTSFSIN